MGTYTYRRLGDGHRIVQRADGGYYLQRQREDGGEWEDVRGPYRSHEAARAWLERRRMRELMAAKQREDTIIYPSSHPRHED